MILRLLKSVASRTSFGLLGSLLFSSVAPVAAAPAQIPGLESTSDSRLDDLLLQEKLIPVRTPDQMNGRAALSALKHRETTRSLRTALRTWSAQPGDYRPLREFLEQNPDSPWAVSIWINLGLKQYRDGYLLRALDCYERAWALGKNETTPEGRATVDRGLGELAALLARLGRFERLGELLLETQDRPVLGAATEMLAGARQGLQLMLYRPSVAFKCGPFALDRILRAKDPKFGGHPAIVAAQSTQQGTSLAQVNQLAAKVGLQMQPAHRDPGAPFLFPSVLHWKAGHFAALIRPVGERYLVEDTTFKDSLSATSAALEEETSGYFLVPAGPLPAGWRSVSEAEAATVWGKGQVNSSNPFATRPSDLKPRSSGNPCGMATYNFHSLLASLSIEDVPSFYTPSFGPAMALQVVYNQREATQTTGVFWTSFGIKTAFNWNSYVIDDPQQLTVRQVVVPGGGGETYTGFGTTINSDETSQVQPESQATLESIHYVITPPGTDPFLRNIAEYRRHLPDGTTMVYGFGRVFDGAVDLFFLTRVIDPQGNTVYLSYDESGRLQYVQDSTTAGGIDFYYPDEFIGPLPIGQDPAPFTYNPQIVGGASFAYDTTGRLTHITDTLGLTSTFVYEGDTDFVHQLVTPYGTTTFERTEQIVSRSAPGGGTVDVSAKRGIKATDPDNHSEYLEYYDADGSAALPIPPGVLTDETPVPIGISVRDQHSANFPTGQTLHFRNSFYWSKKAYQTQPLDYTKAHVFHWLHSADFSSAVGFLESEKPALERRIWYNYQGQHDAVDINGTVYTGSGPTLFSTSLVSKVGRVVGGPSALPATDTQLTQFTYNSLGHPTQIIDPEGRTFTLTYDTNQIDLLEVRNTRAGQNILLAKFADYDKHRPQTVTDGSGNVTHLLYNTRGQTVRITNPKSEITEFVYDTNGFLTDIRAGGQLSGGLVTGGKTIARFTPRTAARALIGTATIGDSTIAGGAAYTTSYQYRSLEQLTTITHPDGTFEQLTYNKLDPEWIRDRAGHLTHILYDYARRPYQITDPVQRVTALDWCGCGELRGIIDGETRTTGFEYDDGGRLTKKTFPDGQFWTFVPEAGSGRVGQKIDGRGQITNYQYFRDDRLKSVSYQNPITATPNVSFTYDPDYGRPDSRTDGQGTATFEYVPYPTSVGSIVNGAGQLFKLNTPRPGGGTEVVQFGYDELGRELTTLLAGHTRSFAYDSLGRLSTDQPDVFGTFLTEYLQNTGLVDQVKLNGNLWTDLTWQTAAQGQRLAQIKNLVPTSGGAMVSQFDYGYDAVGNVTAWQAQRPTTSVDSWAMAFDPADELLRVVRAGPGSGGWTQKGYVYDQGAHHSGESTDSEVAKIDDKTVTTKWTKSGGGLVRVWGTIDHQGTVNVDGVPAYVDSLFRFEGTVSVSGAGPRTFNITATNPEGTVTTTPFTIHPTVLATTTDFSLDGNANVASASNSGPAYTWDAEDRLVKIVQGTSESDFEYDGLNRMVRQVEYQGGTPQSDRRFVWVGFERVAERNASGTLVKLFYPQGFWNAATSQAYLYGTDHLDSIRDVYTATGTVAGTYDYDPYGKLTVVAETAGAGADFGFTGHWRHGPAGQATLWMAPLRTYDPSLGRWLSRDPAGETGGLDLHGYVGNNPVSFIDPLGLRCAGDDALGTSRSNPGQIAQNLAGKGGTPATAAGGRRGGGGGGGGKKVASPASGGGGDDGDGDGPKSSGQLGREGEGAIRDATGLDKNTDSFIVNGRTRIPDFIAARDPVTGLPTRVIEVKNVKSQSLTRQLRDYADLVGKGGRVDVALPPGARVSGPLQRAFDNPNNPLFRMDLPQ